MTNWEYTSDTCDVWELHHLCNHFAQFSWEPVTVVPVSVDGLRLPAKIGVDNGPPLRAGPAVSPLVVLFRRPA